MLRDQACPMLNDMEKPVVSDPKMKKVDFVHTQGTVIWGRIIWTNGTVIYVAISIIQWWNLRPSAPNIHTSATELKKPLCYLAVAIGRI